MGALGGVRVVSMEWEAPADWATQGQPRTCGDFPFWGRAPGKVIRGYGMVGALPLTVQGNA